jgi:hypothetical protein
MDSNTLGQQPDLCKFDAIPKQKEGKATCPADSVSWHMVKIHEKSRCPLLKL